MYEDYYDDNEELEEDDDLVEVSECQCNECHGFFILPLNQSIERCPLCNISFIDT
jgi:hypothetical protein